MRSSRKCFFIIVIIIVISVESPDCFIGVLRAFTPFSSNATGNSPRTQSGTGLGKDEFHEAPLKKTGWGDYD